MPIPEDALAFTDAMADMLRLPDETLAMSYIYLNRYLRFYRDQRRPDPLDLCKNYQLANFFPARAVASGVVFTALEGSGLRVRRDLGDWVKDVGSGKVDKEDMEEVLEILRVN
ncbi:MAG: hypothetical protein Q9197_001997 [Variospora fuerteventurae]